MVVEDKMRAAQSLATRRTHNLGLRLVLVLLVLAAATYGSLRAYIEYEAHRTTVMLDEASRVRIGDSEASVLPLVDRYGGFKWTPEPLPPREQWIDRNEYDYQKNRFSDYSYEFAVSPFGLFPTNDPMGQRGRLTRSIRAVIDALPAHLRAVLGMRDSGAFVALSIQSGRVQSVSAEILVEGRSEWVGYKWEFAEAMPRRELQSRAYSIGAATLTMGSGGGMVIENIFTSRAPEEAVYVARNFNAGCLTSIRGCNGFCDAAPRALQYLKLHPEVAWGIIPPNCGD